MDEQKKMFTNKSVTLFLVIVISVSAIFETIVIALRAMGLAVFLMWVPTIAAIIAGCISQKESNGKISFKKLLQSIGFQKTSIKWILLSCLIPAVYIGIPYVLFWIAFPNSLDMSKASVIQLVLMSVVGIFIGLITAIGEEIGWRGYLVPATLERVGIKKALIYTSIFWGVWHLPILISGLYMPGTPAWYSVPAFLFMIIPVGMIYGIITIKTKSIWPAIFLHAAHNTFDQLIFGTVTVANNKMFFVSETGIFTIIFAWIVAVFLYKKCNDQMVIYRLGLPYYKEFDNFQFIEQTPLLFVSQTARPARAAPFGLLHCYSFCTG